MSNVQQPPFAARPIVLVGMMGCGKTTVGKRLAQRLGRPFIDSDKELEARCGVSVATVFDLEGEPGFRKRESALLLELLAMPDLVLATGGGVVLAPANRQALHDLAQVVYLRASLPELWSRLRNDKQRPLLATANPRQRIAELLQFREPLYEQTAHLQVLTGRQPVDKVVGEVLGLLQPDEPVTLTKS
jgi:shikimate kinase